MPDEFELPAPVDTALLSDAEFLAAFQAGRIPPKSFRHRDHIRAAWLCVTTYELPEAMARVSAALKGFALQVGLAQLYNETITWAYLLIINERVRRGAASDWETFAEGNPDLFTWNPSLLDRYYTRETLRSKESRSIFIWPDKIG
jgi:hypothetical protein